MTRSRFTGLTAGFAAAALIAYALTAAQPATRQAAAPTTGPATATVKKGSLKLDVQLEGILQPADAFEARFKMKSFAGPLAVRKAAPPYAMVKKGDLLIDIDSQPMTWALAGAEGEAEVARANYIKTQKDAELAAKSEALALRMQQDAVKNAEAALKWWQEVDGPQMLLQSDLMLKQSRYGIDDQSDELNELKKMYGEKELATQTADIVIKRAVRRLDLGQVTLKMAEERAQKLKTHDYPIARQRVLDGLEQVRQVLASLELAQAQAAVIRKVSLTNVRTALEQAEKKLAELKEDAAMLTMTAPFDGMVVYGNVADGAWQGGDPKTLKAGEKLAAGSVALRLITPGKLQVEASVPENRGFWVQAGAKAKVTAAAIPQQSYEGVCGALSAQPRGNPPSFGYALTVSLPATDPRLLPGMHATIKIDADKDEKVLLVPLSAVSDNAVSIKLKGGKVEKRKIEIGRSDGQNVEVKSGLAEGDEILTGGK